ncbi:hypothetical protein, conserved [Trypanosoma brucei brucei TREU927]|uniref:Uncharacterized protein n=4 Tax=Trypanozoon TaxID=39700 RepID=Q57ZZ6_TRYB2|nr:hypothetical protein, conserved [Trypanosoma brucei brucei TREU927]AAX80949.1 hypothetical protein, conserved [Trypanosoma brucei]AAZ10659.1 hypothetical protein, conserved [Trypanosoma brucei brucei TREU927]
MGLRVCSASGNVEVPHGAVDHARLLCKVVEGDNPESIKRKRIRGVVRKIEGEYTNWLGECGRGDCFLMLTSLAKSARYLGRKVQQGTAGFKQDDEWSGVSPFFSPGVNDWLCALLQRSASFVTGPEECMVLLTVAVDLELGDTQTLRQLCGWVTGKQYTLRASLEELVCVLRLISLLVKRCRMPIPSLDNMLFRLLGATLDSRQSLTVLSSMVRLRERSSVDVVRCISRRATVTVNSYTVRDVIYALEAISLLNCCHEAYAGAVLDRCTVLCVELKPTELGSVCKYVALLNVSRANNSIALACARELRRLLPALLSRTEALLGRFSLRDARCVLRCLEQHNVRHSVVFSRLTPLVSDLK